MIGLQQKKGYCLRCQGAQIAATARTKKTTNFLNTVTCNGQQVERDQAGWARAHGWRPATGGSERSGGERGKRLLDARQVDGHLRQCRLRQPAQPACHCSMLTQAVQTADGHMHMPRLPAVQAGRDAVSLLQHKRKRVTAGRAAHLRRPCWNRYGKNAVSREVDTASNAAVSAAASPLASSTRPACSRGAQARRAAAMLAA